MRLTEFELTEDELFELSMSPTNLQKMAAQSGAQAGMEFEMIIPGASQDSDDEYDIEPDYDMDERFPTGRGWTREVIDFFMGGDYGSGRSTVQRSIDQLEEAYYEWKGNQYDDWLRNNDDVLFNTVQGQMSQQDDESNEQFNARVQAEISDQGSDYDQAMDEMQEEFDQEDMWDEFLADEGILSMQDFSNQYNLDWPYMREGGGSGGGELSVDDVANDFQKAIGRPVNASERYHGGTREAGKYVVEPDSSLEPDDQNDGGLEFISPPLPLPEMLSDLDKVVAWARDRGAYTTASTGLHMNVSVPDFSQDKLDFVKLAIFLGDEYVLKQFGRAGNTYCKSAMAQIAQTAKTNPDRVKTMLQQMQGNLSAMASKIVHTGSTSKYTSINTKEGYIEFRSPGGDWLGEYAADKSKLKNTLLRFVVALDIAMKPEMFRQEYMKKLYKTLSPEGSDDTIQFFAKFAAGELPQSALKSFVKQAQVQRQFQKNKPGSGEKMVWQVTNTNPRFKTNVEVVATNELAAIDAAAKDWGLTAPEFRVDAVAKPLRLYQEPTADQDTPFTPQSGAAVPPIDFDGNYIIYKVDSGGTVYRFGANTDAEAYNMLQRWRSSMMAPGLDPRNYNVRAVTQQPAQGTGSLPPGNARWLVLDRDDQEVYSFINTTAQSDANQYARNWMINTAPAEVRERGPFTIVPAR